MKRTQQQPWDRVPRAFRFHIATPPGDDFEAVQQGTDYRARALCGLDPPQTYVFDEPVDGQPMCDKCMKRWRRAK